jgi:hypothetical protein
MPAFAIIIPPGVPGIQTNEGTFPTNNIRHGMLIDLTVNGVGYYISNLYSTVTYNGHQYQTMGSFLNITEMQNDLRATNNQLNISLSGIPVSDETPNFLNITLNSKIKGSRIQIYRAFFNSNTLTTIGVYQRYNGYVSNYSLNENWDQDNRLVSNTINLQCSNINAIIEKQFSGRRTNDGDQKRWYPGDTGMYRVKLLADTQFDFGKKYAGSTTNTSGGGGYYDEQGNWVAQ